MTASTAARDTPVAELDHRQQIFGSRRVTCDIQRDWLRSPTAYADVAAGIDGGEVRAVRAQALCGTVDSISFSNAAQIDP